MPVRMAAAVSKSQANLQGAGKRGSQASQRNLANRPGFSASQMCVADEDDEDERTEAVPEQGVVKKGDMDLKIMSSVVFWERRIVTLTESELILSKASEPDLVSARITLFDVLNVFEEGEGNEEEEHASEGFTLVVRTDPLGSSFG